MPAVMPLCQRFDRLPDALRLPVYRRVSWVDSFRLFFKLSNPQAAGKYHGPPLPAKRRCGGLSASSRVSGNETTPRGCVARSGVGAGVL